MSDNGYMGQGVRIDLTNQEYSEEVFSKSDQKKYLGGQSLGVKILYEELESGVDPLSAKNKIFLLLVL